MARFAGSRLLPGVAVLAAIAALILAALAGLAMAGGSGTVAWPYVLRLVRASLVQAALSTVLSLGFGIVLALALARRTQFFGRGLLVAALNAATVFPAIVAVFAVVAVYGRSGWLGDLARAVGLPWSAWLYGLQGILIAHVFFNAPLVARVIMAAVSAVGPEHWRLAAQLGMPPTAVFRLVDWPVIRREAPALAGLVFLACFTSFAIVLALGGGPGLATLEVAIYEALRFEADFSKAAILAALQIAMCVVLVAPVVLLARRPAETGGTAAFAVRPDRGGRRLRAFDAAVLGAAALLVLPPLAATLAAGVADLAALAEPVVWRAVATSLAIGLAAAVLNAGLALAIAGLARTVRVRDHHPRRADSIGIATLAILVVSPMALSAGLFILLRAVTNPFALAAPLIVLVNALMALPFTYRQLEPPLTLSAERYGRLADSLGMAGAARLRVVDWPLLRRPLLAAMAMAMALSLGDLGVAAFFGTGNLVTLPVLLYERLGAYRTDEAAAIALLLALLVLGLFLAAQRTDSLASAATGGGFVARGR